MTTLIKDVFDLLALNAKQVHYYGKYSLVTSSLIILLISTAFHLAMPVPAISEMVSFTFATVINFLIYIIAALFLCLWLKIKKLSVSFSALYSLSALTSVVQILVLPIEGLSTWLELPILLTLNVPLFIYGFIISISALCKGTNASTAFVLSGMLLTFLILVLVSAAMHILGIETGILLPPNDFAVNGQ